MLWTQLSDTQHEFQSGNSTTITRLAMYKTLDDSIDAGECPVEMFRDFSRAFDCIHLDIILEHLNYIGFTGLNGFSQ